MFFFFFNDTATTEIYTYCHTLPLHAALPICALRGPKHGGANEVAFEIQQRYDNPDEAEADIKARVEKKEVVIGFGHPVYTIADPRNKVITEVVRDLSKTGWQSVGWGKSVSVRVARGGGRISINIHTYS